MTEPSPESTSESSPPPNSSDAASQDAEPSSQPAALVARLHAVLDELGTVDLTRCSDDDLLEVAQSSERAIARLTFAGDRQLVEVSDRDLHREMGYRSEVHLFNQYLRISEPTRRRAQMRATATFHNVTGEEMEPKHPTLAKAFADGTVGSGHIRAVLDVLGDIPDAVPHDTKVAAEREMTEVAVELDPAGIAEAGQRLLGHLDPDGELTDEKDRARKRGVWINKQRADGTAKLNGRLTPALAARLSTMLGMWAQPGMNNPDDPESPSGAVEGAAPEALRAAVDRDSRTAAQRNHDAIDALAKAILEDGMLGKSHRGLPPQLVIKADLTDLLRAAGLATTATGTLLPIPDLLAMIDESGVDPWVALFKDATAVPLYFGRRRRLASTPQRLVSFARPGGHLCSTPGCNQPAMWLEMHHAQRDWADGGKTDITELAGACPIHNRRVDRNKPGYFTTGIVDEGADEGRCAWTLNSRPGAPPNPARINRLPDVAAGFTRHLDAVRIEIHGPPEDFDDAAGIDHAADIDGAADIDVGYPDVDDCDVGETQADGVEPPADTAHDGLSNASVIDQRVAYGFARLYLRDIINVESGTETRLADILTAC